MNDLISVIIPVYKQNNNYLKECLESVLNQTYKNIELICIDNGLTKDNIQLLSNYKNITILKNNDSNVSSARNLGISKCNGDWIVFLDSDDYLESNYCDVMLNNAKKSACDLVVSSLRRVYPNKIEFISCAKENEVISDKLFLKKILNVQNNVGFVWGKLWKADVIKKNNILFNENLIVAEDAEFCIKSIKSYNKVCIIKDYLYNYRVNVNSVTKKYDNLYCNNYLNAMIEIKKTLGNNFLLKDNQQDFYNFVVYHLLMIFVNYFYHPNNKNKNKKELLKQAMKEPIFNESLKYSNYDNLSISRKISLFVLKRHCYSMMKMICYIRNKQFR